MLPYINESKLNRLLMAGCGQLLGNDSAGVDGYCRFTATRSHPRFPVMRKNIMVLAFMVQFCQHDYMTCFNPTIRRSNAMPLTVMLIDGKAIPLEFADGDAGAGTQVETILYGVP